MKNESGPKNSLHFYTLMILDDPIIVKVINNNHRHIKLVLAYELKIDLRVDAFDLSRKIGVTNILSCLQYYLVSYLKYSKFYIDDLVCSC